MQKYKIHRSDRIKRVHLKNRLVGDVKITFLTAKMFFYVFYQSTRTRQKSTNLSEYHAKHTKYIVVTGYKRVHLNNEASWRC